MKARLEEAILGTIGARQEMVRRCRGKKQQNTVVLCFSIVVYVRLVHRKHVYSCRKESLWQPGECQMEKERHSLETKYRQS